MADIFPGAKIVQASGFTPRATPSAAQAWSVIHTAASLASAEALALRHSTNPPPGTVSASFWVNRDGTVVQSMTDPRRQAPWTNGVWQNPDLTNARIKAARLAGVNPNLRTLVSIENVSLEPDAPITAAQEASNAKIVAWAHALIGMPVSRETVIGHYQITAIDRPNCPARNKSVIDRIVALATGGADPVLNLISFPDGPHVIEIAAGTTVHGWTAGPATAPAKSQTWPAATAFHADLKVQITNPGGLPNGLFFHAVDGFYAGLYVPTPQVNDAGPLSAITPEDLSAAEKAAADAVAAAADKAAAEFQG